MFGIGTTELIIILLVALIILGPTQLPGIARSLGKALGEFRRVTTDVQRTLNLEAAKIDEEEREKKKAEAVNKAPSSSPPKEAEPKSQADEPVPPPESADPDPYATRQAEVSAEQLPSQEPSVPTAPSVSDRLTSQMPAHNVSGGASDKAPIVTPDTPDTPADDPLTDTSDSSDAAIKKDRA